MPRFWIALVALLAVTATLRLIDLEADPPSGVSRDLSLSTDASWYTAAALDARTGRESGVTGAYDRPLYTAWIDLLYTLFGTSWRTDNLVSVLPSILAVLFVALAARRLYGDAAGWLAGALFALNHALWVFSRSAVPYSTLTMSAALIVWLSTEATCRRSLWPLLVAATVFLVGTLGLKLILILAAPLLFLAWPLPELLRKYPRRGFAVAVLSVAGLGVVAATTSLGPRLWQKVWDYFVVEARGGLGERLLELEMRSGIFAALPVLLPIALLRFARHQPSRDEWPLWTCLVAALALFAPFAYTPLRYLLLLVPVIAILAAGGVAHRLRSVRGEEEKPPCELVPRKLWRIVQTVLLGTAGLWIACALLPMRGLATWCLAATLVALVATIVWLPDGARLHGRGLLRGVAALAILLAVGNQVTRTAAALADSRHTVQRALREADAILGPEARVSGLFGHTLTRESRAQRQWIPAVRFGNGQLRRTYEANDVTHLTIEQGPETERLLAIYARDDAELVPVHTFWVRGIRVHLLRFRFAESSYELSPFERARVLIEEERPAEAIELLESLLSEAPDSAAARGVLADALRASGNDPAALRTALAALAIDPFELHGLGIAVEILLGCGAFRDALPLLERLAETDPQSPAIQKALEFARARVGEGR